MRSCKVERIIIPQMKRFSVRRYLIACWSLRGLTVDCLDTHLMGVLVQHLGTRSTSPPLLDAIYTSTNIYTYTNIYSVDSTPYLNIYTPSQRVFLTRSTMNYVLEKLILTGTASSHYEKSATFFILWNGKWSCCSLEDRFQDPTIYTTEGGVCLYQLAAQPSNSGVHFTAQTATLEKSYIGQIANLILVLTYM